MATKNYIDTLINSDTTVVFTFGYIGAGKTTLLTCLYEYLFRTNYIELNTSGNSEGANYLIRCAGDLREDNKLPPITSTNTIKEVDWIFEMEKQKSVLTFLDMAGEDLRRTSPREKDKITGTNSDGTLNAEITKYLKSEKLPVILLCVIDYERASKDNEIIHKFLSSTKEFDCNFAGAAIIVTKWDKNPNVNQDVSAFIKTNALATLNSLTELVEKPSFFPFSVGKVNDINKELVDLLDLSYCKPILEWLHYTSINNNSSIYDNNDESTKNILEYLKIFFNHLKDIPFFNN